MNDRNFFDASTLSDAAFSTRPPGSPKPTCRWPVSGEPTSTFAAPQVLVTVATSAGTLVIAIATCPLPNGESATTLPALIAVFGIAPSSHSDFRNVSASRPGAWLNVTD